ncbi:hypothetical protein T440DRAFT_323663 [Plenodomus tracheiphilus IPT5]|uniref:Uncharacterized protein n=1 Tax=Plenodomus tracheiphilus IPT5 TaxID=1408161 RepID=A0A6A7BFP6_9PLEO|nr:hypothetical protein T440DRAFT_323663 [Plenodomus tracheiphilus IPT5]
MPATVSTARIVVSRRCVCAQVVLRQAAAEARLPWASGLRSSPCIAPAQVALLLAAFHGPSTRLPRQACAATLAAAGTAEHGARSTEQRVLNRSRRVGGRAAVLHPQSVSPNTAQRRPVRPAGPLPGALVWVCIFICAPGRHTCLVRHGRTAPAALPATSGDAAGAVMVKL